MRKKKYEEVRRRECESKSEIRRGTPFLCAAVALQIQELELSYVELHERERGISNIFNTKRVGP